MTRIGIVGGSTRPRRRAELVARWVHEVAVRHMADTDVAFELIDLADSGLPLLDEPVPAAIGSMPIRTLSGGRRRSPPATGS
jgi:NAD(P)H-dependent FMN reductase